MGGIIIKSNNANVKNNPTINCAEINSYHILKRDFHEITEGQTIHAWRMDWRDETK